MAFYGSLGLAFVLCLEKSVAVHVTFVTYGISLAYSRASSTRHTAAGLEVAIQDFNAVQNSTFTDLNMTCDHVVLEVPNSVECDQAGANSHMVSAFYYSRKWDADNRFVLLTPGCGDGLLLGTLAREWNVFMIATAFMYSETRSRAYYPSYVTVSPIQSNVIAETFFALFDRYNWTTIGIIYDTSSLPGYSETVTALKTLNTVRGSPVQLSTIAIQSAQQEFTPASVLLTVRTFSRVILLSMTAKNTRKFLLAASKLSMTNDEYVYLTVETNPAAATGNLTWEANDDNDMVAFDSYRRLLQVSVCERTVAPSLQPLLERIVNVSKKVYNSTYLPLDPQPSDISIAAYQAFFLYLQVFQEVTALRGELKRLGRDIAKRMLDRDFNTTFGSLYIDEGGQRRSPKCVKDLNLNSRLFQSVLRYDPVSRSLEAFANSQMDWYTHDENPPRNEPLCGYQGQKAICQSKGGLSSSETAAVVCSLLVTSLFLWLFIRKLTKEVALRRSKWLLDPAHLASKEVTFASSATGKAPSQPFEVPHYTYRKRAVFVKQYSVNHGQNFLQGRHARKILHQVSEISHNNILYFYGICVQNNTLSFVSEFCPRGTLKDFLEENTKAADWELRCFLVADCLEGLKCIYESPIKRHGSLNSSTCYIDLRFTLKISDLGYLDVVGDNSDHRPLSPSSGFQLKSKTFWELCVRRCGLKRPNSQRRNVTAADDILSVGIIILETLFSNVDETQGNAEPKAAATKSGLRDLATACCHSNAKQRPAVGTVRLRFRNICQITADGVFASIQQRMELYALQLERLVQDRTAALIKERAANDSILMEVLPRWAVNRLSAGLQVTPELFPSTTVFFSLIWGFLYFVVTHEPLEIFTFVSELFSRFDRAVAEFDVFKVETTEDQYLVVAGIYRSDEDRHAPEICRMALSFHRGFLEARSERQVQFMAGIHSGPCVAGVTGTKTPRYCLFGDTVNVASRLSSQSKPGKIQISSTTAEQIRHSSEFFVKKRGLMELKGRGEVETFWLLSK